MVDFVISDGSSFIMFLQEAKGSIGWQDNHDLKGRPECKQPMDH